MTGNINMHMLAYVGHRYLIKGRGVDQKTSRYLVWPPHASCSATHLLRVELIRLLIVACRMLSHSSSVNVRSCWLLAGTGTSCRTCRSRASLTGSMGDMSGEYAGHGRTGTLSATRNCVQILVTWVVHYHAETWGDGGWMNGTTTGLKICSFKLPSIKCNRVRCL